MIHQRRNANERFGLDLLDEIDVAVGAHDFPASRTHQQHAELQPGVHHLPERQVRRIGKHIDPAHLRRRRERLDEPRAGYAEIAHIVVGVRKRDRERASPRRPKILPGAKKRIADYATEWYWKLPFQFKKDLLDKHYGLLEPERARRIAEDINYEITNPKKPEDESVVITEANIVANADVVLSDNKEIEQYKKLIQQTIASIDARYPQFHFPDPSMPDDIKELERVYNLLKTTYAELNNIEEIKTEILVKAGGTMSKENTPMWDKNSRIEIIHDNLVQYSLKLKEESRQIDRTINELRTSCKDTLQKISEFAKLSNNDVNFLKFEKEFNINEDTNLKQLKDYDARLQDVLKTQKTTEIITNIITRYKSEKQGFHFFSSSKKDKAEHIEKAFLKVPVALRGRIFDNLDTISEDKDRISILEVRKELGAHRNVFKRLYHVSEKLEDYKDNDENKHTANSYVEALTEYKKIR